MWTIDPAVDARGRQATEQLIDERICASGRYVLQTPSTNTLALGEVRTGQLRDSDCPKLFLTDRQTSGRGRHGRTWVSSSGTLTFSLVVHVPRDSIEKLQLLALAVGVGAAQAIEFELAPLQTKLKWPNDVYVDGGKVGGILLETTAHCPEQRVIGVGLNVHQRPDLGEEAQSNSVRDLSAATGKTLQRYELLQPLVRSILESIGDLETNPDTIVGAFRTRCWLTDCQIGYQDGSVLRQGICRGVSDDGRLIVETADGMKKISSGEAHRVRVERQS